MAEKKEFKGIQFSRTNILGKVVGVPQIFMHGPEGDKKGAFFTLEAEVPEQTGKGWERKIILHPILVLDSNRVEKLIEPYVKEGRELYVEAYYSSWKEGTVDKHAFIATSVMLGRSPFERKDDKDYKPAYSLPGA